VALRPRAGAKRSSLVRFAIATIAVFAPAACSAMGGNEPGTASADGTTTILAVGQRIELPDIRGTTLAGKSFSLAAYRGKVVVLNFWASNCGPCRIETPALQLLAGAISARGVQFVGVDTRETDLNAARAFLRNVGGHGTPYLNLADPDGAVALAFSGSLPPNAIPSTLLIDRRGRLAVRIIGPTTQPRLEAVLAPLISEVASMH
jgi:thiol-disulfide isomerase/thioredoxin